MLVAQRPDHHVALGGRIDLRGNAPGQQCVAEVFGRHFQLPDRGPVGSNGMADERDFVAPVLIGAITAVVSSFWPALRAARARPADALRQA